MTQQTHAALLMEDIQEAQLLSTLFRKAGVVPSFYENLEDYWFAVMNDVPTLSVIDVRLMSQGKMALKNHPCVASDELPIVFYYSKETKPLLFSTHEVFNYGNINGDEPIEGQLKGILKRVNKFHHFNTEVSSVRKEIQRVERSNDKLIFENSKLQEKKAVDENLKDFMLKLDELVRTVDFTQAMSMLFEDWNVVDEYCFFELDPFGQKLVSPSLKGVKFKSIPELWLGQTFHGGIKLVAQKMADQVSYDVLGPDVISLKLKGQYELPEFLVYLKVKEDLRGVLEWPLLENLLSGYYSRFRLQTIATYVEESSLVNNWEFMSLLDQEVSKQKLKSQGLVNVNFKGLLKAITDNAQYQFEFKQFFDEFTNKISNRSKTDFKVINFNLENIAFLLDSAEAPSFLNLLKDFVKRFNYFKFFKKPDNIMLEKILPEVQMVPVSPYSYETFITREEDLMIETKERPRKPKKIIDFYEA
jgi:hypothetical protein